MTTDLSMRRILWAATLFNFGGAILFAFPASPLGQLVGLPIPVPGIYCAILAFLIALLGVSYAWLALQSVINRPLVAFSTAGKAGVFTIVLIFWLMGGVPVSGVIVASGDLIFAVLFARWLWRGVDAK